MRNLYSSEEEEEEEGHRGKAKKGSGERRRGGGARGAVGGGSEGLRWDPLHINSPDIDEMIRRGLGPTILMDTEKVTTLGGV